MTAAKCAHWGTHGAAGLLVVDKGKVLLQLRAQAVHEPGTWSIPGGARLKDETPEDAALREAREETGLDPQAVKIVATYSAACECGWTYTTLIANLVGTVDLRGNWESQELRWVPLDDVETLQLHPGLRAAWADLHDMLKADDTKPNISQVAERLWTGGDRGRTSMATWLAQLQMAGISHLIDARPHGRSDQAYVQAHAPQIGYLFNPQHDNGQKMPDWWFADGVDFALHAMRDPAAKVLAHCQLGWNRGPSMAFAILLATGMTPEMARSTIVGARPIARLAYADDAAKWWTALTAPEVFYHGGTPGLHVGDMLLPPAVTGMTSMLDRLSETLPEMPASWEPSFRQHMASIRQRENQRVFVTKDLWYAIEMAARHHAVGAVYQVEPLNNLKDTTSWPFSETTCDRARILEVVKERVTWESALADETARRVAKYALADTRTHRQATS
jgi:8-oxo-dGTP pyrophosphatase MutT (NUDIX family)